MPYSPYDFDNHVVVEIYDKKWIMLDPTIDGIFIDENRTPLSLLEIRENLLMINLWLMLSQKIN